MKEKFKIFVEGVKVAFRTLFKGTADFAVFGVKWTLIAVIFKVVFLIF